MSSKSEPAEKPPAKAKPRNTSRGEAKAHPKAAKFRPVIRQPKSGPPVVTIEGADRPKK